MTVLGEQGWVLSPEGVGREAEKAPGRPHSARQGLKGLRESWGGALCSDRTRGMVLN